ncbi:flavin reductase family protein [Nocardioides sp.]|uniref:flavin reductase family protein n=1 Tax=Nocardioides sp. TaxID=35761 RepID=UPI0039E31776
MTIHSTHPFPTPEDPVRRLRGRLGGAVSLWTAGPINDPAGLTVSSLMVAAGEPARLLGLVDPDSDLADALTETGRAVVQLLSWRHRDLAEAFAGTAPAPGGPFRLGSFEETAWGPRLADAATWAGVAVESTTEVGWSRLVTAVVEEIHVGEDDEPLFHRRGRYARAAIREGPRPASVVPPPASGRTTRRPPPGRPTA